MGSQTAQCTGPWICHVCAIVCGEGVGLLYDDIIFKEKATRDDLLGETAPMAGARHLLIRSLSERIIMFLFSAP